MKKNSNYLNYNSSQLQDHTSIISEGIILVGASWNNTWGMEVNPLNHKEGISIHLVGCPIADFAKKNGYSELMPYFCETDKAVMEHLGGALYREHTVADGYEDCDYWIKNKGE